MTPTLLIGLFFNVLEPQDVRPEQSALSLQVAVYTSDASIIGVGDSSDHGSIDAVWIAVHDVRLRLASACKSDKARSITSAFTREVVRHGPAPDSTPVDQGHYCGLELLLRRSSGKAADAPPDLRNASILIEGHRADGIRFLLRSHITPPMLLRASSLDGIAVTAPDTSWILGIDVARWFAGIDLQAAEASRHGREREIRIDDKSNRELLALFNANVGVGFALFDDANHDRNLDPEERSKPIAAHE